MSTNGKSMKDLMKSQEVSSPLNRALKLNEQLEGMREKNVILYDQNQELTAKNKDLMREREGLVQLVSNLNKELDELRISSTAKEKKLRQELSNMQASWDSLYEEHRRAEERRHRELRAKNEKFVSEEDKVDQQAQLLRNVVKKQSVPSDNVSPMEKRLHLVEDENKKLKSKVVQLQTKYREEKYKNEHGTKDLDSISTTDSESERSDEKSPTHSGNLLVGFKNINLSRRQNANPRAPKFAQTKNLWGRMTNNKTKQGSSVDFTGGINLAFSRDD